MTSTVFLRPHGYARWCQYRSAIAGDGITTACGAVIAQGEPLELADDVPAPGRCAACEATVRLEQERAEALCRLAMRTGELDVTGFASDTDGAPGPGSAAIRAVLDTEHEDLLGDDVGAFDHLNDLRELDE
ncbi:MAG: hypothetical protein E6J90_11305 [Deltaproteobacteria bacterium]|nr:MAG: hypothetical protein E6J91_19780 [Deltaproteobacteria bacterium]TMQ23081.1 MAG: hypothetical protein E6J90_11305 [Deltaproteobacteria bacterium]